MILVESKQDYVMVVREARRSHIEWPGAETTQKHLARFEKLEELWDSVFSKIAPFYIDTYVFHEDIEFFISNNNDHPPFDRTTFGAVMFSYDLATDGMSLVRLSLDLDYEEERESFSKFLSLVMRGDSEILHDRVHKEPKNARIPKSVRVTND